MPTAIMQELPKDAVFIGPDRNTKYKVTVPATDDPNGFVHVWNLSMDDATVLERIGNPNWCEPGVHPREGFFAYTFPTEVEVIP